MHVLLWHGKRQTAIACALNVDVEGKGKAKVGTDRLRSLDVSLREPEALVLDLVPTAAADVVQLVTERLRFLPFISPLSSKQTVQPVV